MGESETAGMQNAGKEIGARKAACPAVDGVEAVWRIPLRLSRLAVTTKQAICGDKRRNGRSLSPSCRFVTFLSDGPFLMLPFRWP